MSLVYILLFEDQYLHWVCEATVQAVGSAPGELSGRKGTAFLFATMDPPPRSRLEC